MENNLAPIVLFAYKRLPELEQTLKALKANYLAQESELYVFVDGPKHIKDDDKVIQVRSLLDKLTGFKEIHRYYRQQNLGCTTSIITGLKEVLAKHSAVIVVEDDIVTSPNFLDYMNQSLVKYQKNPKVFSIGGYTFPFKKPIGYTSDVYFFPRTCAWGWATWADRMDTVDWDVSDFEEFMRDPAKKKAFNRGGTDLVRMLRLEMAGEIGTWDIRLCYNQYKRGGLTAYPVLSKVQNIGFDSVDGTHTNVYNRYKTEIDKGEQTDFSLPEEVNENNYYTRIFQNKYSLFVRGFNRLKTYAGIK